MTSLEEMMIDAERLAPLKAGPDQYTIVGSRSHPSEALNAFLEEKRRQYGQVTFVSAGSSLKFCLLAEGRAHVYPRLGPTMEWDTAAGHAVVAGAGCTVCRYSDGSPLRYNKEDLLNPWFVVSSPLVPMPPEAAA
jgi:3'(2'), 5'-bisphosphate nucleotidase